MFPVTWKSSLCIRRWPTLGWHSVTPPLLLLLKLDLILLINDGRPTCELQSFIVAEEKVQAGRSTKHYSENHSGKYPPQERHVRGAVRFKDVSSWFHLN
jgi:hypothetical protein